MTVSSTATTAGATPNTPAAAPATALSSLSGNFTDFLKLLMTQLRNQDPTSPMDTNQFTTQLVQFSSVEQQINANTKLTTLIQATQGNTLLQSSTLVGQKVEVKSDQISLQNGQGAIHFQTPTARQVDIGIYSPAGVKLSEAVVESKPGANAWSWNGQDRFGKTLPDGAYKVVTAGVDGSAVPFTVLGTATAVQRTGTAVNVNLGGLSVDFSAIQSVGAAK